MVIYWRYQSLLSDDSKSLANNEEESTMVKIDLSDEERTILEEALEVVLSELRMEIADTDRLAFREKLKERKRIIEKTVIALNRVQSGT